MKAIRLRTEYLRDPMGIDIDRPRLMWNCQGGIKQTAYQIIAEDCAGAPLWDSGRVESSSMRVRWGGEALKSRQEVVWKIRLWDESDTPGKWASARFETGLLKPTDWNAAWITGNYRVNKKQRYPVDCFRRKFTAKAVKRARLYITACGLYEARLNGDRVGDFVLAPGITDYRKRVQYQTYDVTGLLREGENELAVQLADGWYRGCTGAWGLRNQYGTETKLLAQLEILHEDGGWEMILSGGDWEWSNDGPIRFADNKDGEVVEAGRTPGYSGRARRTSHPVVPSASNNVPVAEHESLHPALITTPSGKKVLDFGQNIAGYAAFSISARAGQTIKLRFGEMLDENGEFTQKNIQCSNKKITTPLQQVLYTCKEGRNEYKTTFAIFGFQYIQVEADVAFVPEDFTAIAVYSDMERTGFFQSSNPLLDKFVENTLWSAKNNHADLPTDCPTRERHGWTGDAQIFFGTAAYLLDYASMSQKFLRDMYDWQRADGCLPQIAPSGGVDAYMSPMNGSVGWADAGIIIPYQFCKLYGDREILRRLYGNMKRYGEFMIKRCGKRGLLAKKLGLSGEAERFAVNAGQSYGEWAEPEDVHPMDWKDMAAPHPEVSTAYTAYVLGLLAEIAGELDEKEDERRYRDISGKCRRAYQALRETPAHSLDTDRQASLVRPLAFELLSDTQREFAQKRLLEALEHYGWRVGTGFLSTPLILDVLADIDLEAAYRLLENEEMPGWLFMPKHGATTIWESWEGTCAQKGVASLNHYSKGAVCRWLFDTMCGIRPNGENHFIIAPRPGGRFTHAGAGYLSVYGQVESRWERTETGVKFTVTIPANCTATVRLPDGSAVEQGAGECTYILEM